MPDEFDFLEEDEEIADEEDLLAPLDVQLFFEMVKEVKNSGNWVFDSEQIEEISQPYCDTWERAEKQFSAWRKSNI